MDSAGSGREPEVALVSRLTNHWVTSQLQIFIYINFKFHFISHFRDVTVWRHHVPILRDGIADMARHQTARSNDTNLETERKNGHNAVRNSHRLSKFRKCIFFWTKTKFWKCNSITLSRSNLIQGSQLVRPLLPEFIPYKVWWSVSIVSGKRKVLWVLYKQESPYAYKRNIEVRSRN